MKKSFTIITLLIPFFLFGFALAGSNNGYTTAANVYTGSSSQTWYGGGVAFVLAKWRKEEAAVVSPIIEETASESEKIAAELKEMASESEEVAAELEEMTSESEEIVVELKEMTSELEETNINEIQSNTSNAVAEHQ